MKITTPQKVASSSIDLVPDVVNPLGDPPLVNFCIERGLVLEIAAKAGLHYPQEGEYAGMLAIPYQKRHGGVWTTRYKTGHDKPKYLSEAGAPFHLYNPQHLGPPDDQIWFCEGELDTLILWQYGVPAVGLGGSTMYQHPMFAQAFSLLFNRAEIIVATDNDSAGDAAYNDLCNVYGQQTKRLLIPEGISDVNDWHLEDSKGLEKAIARINA